jgi:hypothetical protein
MLRRMLVPGPQENTKGSSPDNPQREAVRLVGIALWRERRHIEKLLNGLLVDINTEIGLLDKRMSAKLQDIDTSLSLIARELARRASEPPAGYTGTDT